VMVLGLSGSPRAGGNTALLLGQFLEGALSQGAQIKNLDLTALSIQECLHCDACLKKGFCRQRDDMGLVYEGLKEADVIAIASPLQFMTVTAPMKAAIDRCQALWVRKYVLNSPPLWTEKKRLGVFISVGGQKGAHVFDAARTTIKALFTSLDIEYWGELVYAGIDKKGAITHHPDALKEAFELGVRSVEELE